MMFNAGPYVHPYSDENALTSTLNSCTAPIGTVATPVWRPQPSSLLAPSSKNVVARREPTPQALRRWNGCVIACAFCFRHKHTGIASPIHGLAVLYPRHRSCGRAREFVRSMRVGPRRRPIFEIAKPIDDAPRAEAAPGRTFAANAPALNGASAEPVSHRKLGLVQVDFFGCHGDLCAASERRGEP